MHTNRFAGAGQSQPAGRCPGCQTLVYLSDSDTAFLPTRVIEVFRDTTVSGRPLALSDTERQMLLTQALRHQDMVNKRISSARFIAEEEWDMRFGWSPDEHGTCNTIDDTEENRARLRRLERYVWSEVNAFDCKPNVSGWIVPGITVDAICFYLCDRP